MSQDKRIPLPTGLPNRFADAQDGFERLRELLEIPNTKHLEGILNAEVAKNWVQDLSVAKLRGAVRRRTLLTALYPRSTVKTGH